MSEEQLHELARKVMEAIKPNQNLDLEEFALRVEMIKPQHDLCDFILKLFDSDTEKWRYIHKIKTVVNENNGSILMSDFELEFDITIRTIGCILVFIDALYNDSVSVTIEDDFIQMVTTTVNYEDLSLDTLKEIYGVLEKHKKQ